MRRQSPVHLFTLPPDTVPCLLLLLATLTFSVACRAQSIERPSITGIAFVRVYASDLPASAAFYAKTLGFGHADANGIRRYGVNNSQWLEVEALPTPAPASRLAAVAFTTSDAAALERYLKVHAVDISEPLARGTFGVHDPEGNLILFVQQGTHPAGLPSGSPDQSPGATSHRILHAGFVVTNRTAEDRFYRDLLGFRPYWHGGPTDDRTDYVSLQVPDGREWLEYMLNVGPHPSPQMLGGANHLSLGVAHMPDAVAALARNHCEGANCTRTQMGRDGKVQLNLFDPDLTRVEFMEFQPSGTICCSAFTGKHPTEVDSR